MVVPFPDRSRMKIMSTHLERVPSHFEVSSCAIAGLMPTSDPIICFLPPLICHSQFPARSTAVLPSRYISSPFLSRLSFLDVSILFRPLSLIPFCSCQFSFCLISRHRLYSTALMRQSLASPELRCASHHRGIIRCHNVGFEARILTIAQGGG